MAILARKERSLALAPSASAPQQGAGATSADGALPVNALIGQGASFEGRLVFEGTVHIHGLFKGEIRSKDTLVVGEGGRVEGEIHVGTLVVMGEIQGVAKAAELIELKAPASVGGSLEAPSLVVERGVRLDATTRMTGGRPD